MNRTFKIAFFLFLILVLASTVFLVQKRVSWELESRNFSLVVTESELRGFLDDSGLEKSWLVERLKSAGVRGVLLERTPFDLSVDSSTLAGYREAGLQAGLKLKNPLVGSSRSSDNLERVLEKNSFSFLVFEEPGFSGNSGKVLDRIEKKNIPLGVVEFGSTAPAKELFEDGYRNFFRYHRIESPGGESPEEEVDRYVRAVKERNIGVVEFSLHEERGLGPNLNRISETADRLEGFGYRLVNPDRAKGAGKVFPSSELTYLPLVLFPVVLFLLFISRFGDFPELIYWLLGPTGIAGISAAYFAEPLLVRQIAALSYAVLGPAAVYYFALRVSRSFSADLKRASVGLIGATSLTCLFGLFLSATLTDYEFMMKIYQFRGVKFSLLFPLFTILLLSCRKGALRLENFRFGTREVLFTLSLILLFGFLLVRSGNEAFLPVLEAEESVRTWLETHLLARPRFKEFLIGHPAFFVWMYMYFEFENGFYRALFLLLGFLGQVTIINTFAHIHSPLFISLLRTLNGLVLGGIGGLVLLGFRWTVMELGRRR